MSLVRYYCAASLDGYIAESDDGLDWLLRYGGAEDVGGGGYEAFYEEIGALVMGSTTYEWVLAHVDWPYAGKPAWVLTSRHLATPEGEDVDIRFVRGGIRDHVEEMLASARERDLWIVGGGNVASQFAEHGLIDQVEVTVVPVVLGAGKPLFDRRLPGGPMRLLGSRALPNGMVELRYEM